MGRLWRHRSTGAARGYPGRYFEGSNKGKNKGDIPRMSSFVARRIVIGTRGTGTGTALDRTAPLVTISISWLIVSSQSFAADSSPA